MTRVLLQHLSEAFGRRVHQFRTEPRGLGPQLYTDLVIEWGERECGPILERMEQQLATRAWLRLIRQPPVHASRSALIRTLVHAAPISCVAWSAHRLATADSDGTIQLWDPDTGEAVAALESDARILALSWAPDGERLAASSDDATLRIWEPETGKVTLFAADGKGASVLTVACSPDWRYLAVANGIKTQRIFDSDTTVISIWNLASGNQEAEWSCRGSVSALSWSPDQQLIAGAAGSVVHIWEVLSGAAVARISWGGMSVRGIAWSPDGTQLASIGNRAVVKLSNPRNGKTLRELKGHIDSVKAVAWSRDGKRLASLGEERALAIWECERFKQIATTIVNGYGSLAWSLDDTRIALASDREVQLWNVVALDAPHQRKATLLPVRTAAFSPDGKSLAAGGNKGWLHVWNSVTGKPRAARQIDPWGIDVIAWAPDKSGRLAASGLSGLHLWNTQSDELRTLMAWKGGSVQVEWSEDSELLIIGVGNALLVYHVATETVLREIALGANHGRFNREPSSGMLAIEVTGTRRVQTKTSAWTQRVIERVRVLRGDGGGTVAEFAVPEVGINWFDWVPGARLLAISTEDEALHLWPPEDPGLAGRMSLKEALPRPLAWSCDGSLFAAARGQDLCIQDVSSGRMRSIECQDQVAAARFSNDGKHIAAADFGRASGHQPIPYLFELR